MNTEVSTDITHINICPLCHAVGFSRKEKKFLGVFPITRFACPSCGVSFSKSGKESYVIANVTDKTPAIWQTYAKQPLTVREWITIGNGGMSDAEQHDADMEKWMDELRQGMINVSCVNAPTAIILKKDEKVIAAFPNIVLKESRAVRVSRGSYGGPSFRVAKGLYFRLGSTSSTSQSHGEIKDIDTGILTVTNQRFVYSGKMKGVDIALRKITGLEPYSDGIALHREGYQKTQYFTWRGNLATLNIGVSGRQYQEPLSGLVLKYLIEGAVHSA